MSRSRVVVVLAVVLVGFGLVACGTPPPIATSLKITTNDFPVPYYGQNYNLQLTAVGASGPITWTQLSGTLPSGLSLAPDGVVSGVPDELGPGGGLVRVQADDGTAQVTKLFLLFSMAVGDPPASGPPLPEGNRLAVAVSPSCQSGVCRSFFVAYHADGSTSAVATMSVQSLRAFAGELFPISPDGTKVVDFTIPSTPGPSTGPVIVRDGETGAVLRTLEPSSAFAVGRISFSPDGSKLALQDSSGAVRIFDTTSWTVIGSFSGSPLGPWSPDSSEISESSANSATVTIYSASGTGSRTVPSPSTSCFTVPGWSATNRLALFCSDGIKTISAVDGGTVHNVVTNSPGISYSMNPGSWDSTFSPSGTRLAFTESSGSFPPDSSRVVIANDVDSASLTELFSTDAPAFASPIDWT